MNAADEGRELLSLILEDEALGIDLDAKEDWEIEVWMEELGFTWIGCAWMKDDEESVPAFSRRRKRERRRRLVEAGQQELFV